MNDTSVSSPESAAPQPVDLPPPGIRRRRWLFRLTAAAIPFLAICLANVVLYVAGVGIDTTLVAHTRRVPEGDVAYLNPAADLPFCGIDFLGPEPRGFALPKAANGFRVMVLGASSVEGYPHPSELAFPHRMELMLARQLPDRKVDVLNMGVIGLSTSPLTDLLHQCLAANPDLIVVYAGHNEFYGAGGVATNEPVNRLVTSLRRFRLIQALESAAGRADENSDQELITRLPSSFRIPETSPLIGRAAAIYRQNLIEMCRVSTAGGVPVLLCGAVANLRDQSPIRAATSLDARSQDFESGIEELMTQGEIAAAELQLESVLGPQSNDAVLEYRLAQCLERQGDRPAAADAYRRARDLDECRYRAPGVFRDIELQVADEAGPLVQFLDLEPVFFEQARGAAPGDDLFLEHVHFTLAGHRLMARAISRKIVTDFCQQAFDESAVPSSAEEDEWLGLVPEDELAGIGLAWFLVQNEPFSEAVDSQMHQAALGQKIRDSMQALPDGHQQLFMSIPHSEKVGDLVDGMGRALLAEGRPGEALRLFEFSKRRRPWMPNGFVFSAICEELLGRSDEAEVDLEASTHTVLPETLPVLKDRDRLTSRLHDSRRPNHGRSGQNSG